MFFLSKNNREATWRIDHALGIKLILIAWGHAISSVWGRSSFWHSLCNSLLTTFCYCECLDQSCKHTCFYSFTACKNAEIEVSISSKPWTIFSWNLDKACITSWRTTLVSFGPIQCMVFEKMTIITYNHFAYISIFVHQMNLRFREQKHHGKRNILTNIQEKFLRGFRENGHNHLQPICIFLKIRNVGFSNFWCEYVLEW